MSFRVPRADRVYSLSVRSLLACLSLAASLLVGPGHALATIVTVTMVGFEFSPRDTTIAVGDTVTWVNPEGMFHTVTSGASSSDPEAGFTFDEYFLGDFEQTFSYAFSDSGTYPYFCRFHEGLKMVGSVTVRAQAGTSVPATAAAPRLVARPNPTREATTLTFQLPASTAARVAVYDLTGRLVREIFRGTLPEGAQAITWDGRDDAGAVVSSGRYLLRLDAPRGTSASSVMLLH